MTQDFRFTSDGGEARGIPHDEPVFHISVVARMVGVHQQTLRSYERQGLLQPSRSAGKPARWTSPCTGCCRASSAGPRPG